jgi:hypothetical protein
LNRGKRSSSGPDVGADSYMDMDRGLKRRCSLHREGFTKSGRVESGMLKGKRHSNSLAEEGSSNFALFITSNVPGRHQWMKGGLEALNSRWYSRRYSRSVIVMTSSPRYGIVRVQMSSTVEIK